MACRWLGELALRLVWLELKGLACCLVVGWFLEFLKQCRNLSGLTRVKPFFSLRNSSVASFNCFSSPKRQVQWEVSMCRRQRMINEGLWSETAHLTVSWYKKTWTKRHPRSKGHRYYRSKDATIGAAPVHTEITSQ